jgi:hypothetical protein
LLQKSSGRLSRVGFSFPVEETWNDWEANPGQPVQRSDGAVSLLFQRSAEFISLNFDRAFSHKLAALSDFDAQGLPRTRDRPARSSMPQDKKLQPVMKTHVDLLEGVALTDDELGS